MSARARKALLVGGQIVLYAVIAVFVYRSLSTAIATSGFTSVRFDLRFLVLSWVLLAGYYALYTGGLHLIMRRLGSASTLPRAFKLNFASNLGKYVPGGFWPALGRVALAPGLGMSRTHAALSLVLEAGLSSAGGLIVFVISLGFGGTLPPGTQPWQYAALAAVLVAALHPSIFRRVLGFGFRVAKVDAPVPHLSFAATIGLVAYYVVSWLVAGAAFRFFTLAIVAGAPGRILSYAGFYAAASIAGLVVVFAPGGLGVREGVLAALLTPLVGPGPATLVGFSSRVWSTLMEIVLSAAAVALPIGVRAEAPAAEKPGEADR